MGQEADTLLAMATLMVFSGSGLQTVMMTRSPSLILPTLLPTLTVPGVLYNSFMAGSTFMAMLLLRQALSGQDWDFRSMLVLTPALAVQPRTRTTHAVQPRA
jgi:hypothetical protein